MGSPFASHTQSDPIPLPFDPPHTVTIRKLTGREIEKVQEAHRGGIATSNPRVWGAFFRRALEQGSASDPDVQKLLQDPLLGYDRYALVRAGLVAWSYPLSVKPIAARPAVMRDGIVITPAVEAVDAVEDLDDEAVDFIATEVLRLTKPHLFFQSVDDMEADQKKVDGPAPIARREGAATV